MATVKGPETNSNIVECIIFFKACGHGPLPPDQLLMGYRTTVIHEGKSTELFEVRTGTRQGCLLSLFLSSNRIEGPTSKKKETDYVKGRRKTLSQLSKFAQMSIGLD